MPLIKAHYLYLIKSDHVYYIVMLKSIEYESYCIFRNENMRTSTGGIELTFFIMNQFVMCHSACISNLNEFRQFSFSAHIKGAGERDGLYLCPIQSVQCILQLLYFLCEIGNNLFQNIHFQNRKWALCPLGLFRLNFYSKIS